MHGKHFKNHKKGTYKKQAGNPERCHMFFKKRKDKIVIF
jgi:hypothetical protein